LEFIWSQWIKSGRTVRSVRSCTGSWAAAWAHSELSTPPKTYLAFLVLAVPSSWYIWAINTVGKCEVRCAVPPRSHGGQTEEVEAKKTLGGFQEEMLPVMSLFCRNSELARNHDNPWYGPWSLLYASMGPYGAPHAPKNTFSVVRWCTLRPYLWVCKFYSYVTHAPNSAINDVEVWN
jgi:hypothetical protein